MPVETVAIEPAAATPVTSAPVAGASSTEPQSSAQPSKLPPLARFPEVGTDLRKLAPEKLVALRARLGVPAKASTSFFALQPWALLRMDAKRLVLVEIQPLIMIPGNSGARIHVVHRDGVPLGSTQFATGWRQDVNAVRAGRAPGLGAAVIEIDAQSMYGAREQQIYALAGDRIALVRVQDPQGKAKRNHYGAPNWTVGPPPPVRDEQAWLPVLRKGSLAEQLEALVWLAGIHLDVSSLPSQVSHEDPDQARLVERVRAKPEVQQQLKAWTAHRHPWFRDTARLALSPERYQSPGP